MDDVIAGRIDGDFLEIDAVLVVGKVHWSGGYGCREY